MILVKFTFGSFLNPPDKNTGHSESQKWSIGSNIQFLTRPTKVGQGNYNFQTDSDTTDQVLLLFLLLTILTSEPGQLLLVKVYHHLDQSMTKEPQPDISTEYLRNLGFGFLGVDKISLLSACRI